jgi:hypothetical protein
MSHDHGRIASPGPASSTHELAPYLATDTRARCSSTQAHGERNGIEDMVAELPQEYEPLIRETEGEFAGVRPAEVILQRIAVDEARDVPVDVDAFVDDPAETLIHLSQSLRLLVCGSRGYGPARAVLLGSASRNVTTGARCPVIVVPRGRASSLEAVVSEHAAHAEAI